MCNLECMKARKIQKKKKMKKTNKPNTIAEVGEVDEAKQVPELLCEAHWCAYIHARKQTISDKNSYFFPGLLDMIFPTSDLDD